LRSFFRFDEGCRSAAGIAPDLAGDSSFGNIVGPRSFEMMPSSIATEG
jgi:hypothetical protein